MKVRRAQSARLGLFIFTAFWFFLSAPTTVYAAPYAAVVMDARTGEVMHSRNADTRLHPASLTKMMTLYIVFQAVERGEISLDTKVKISSHSANEQPSKLGLRAGQRIKLRYLIRAAAVKSANDAATAIGEALSGSEAAFARRMNRTAKSLGMTRTTFKNAHGLTEKGHMSTARDMSILGRHMIYDYPQYYNLFSRRSTDAGVRKVNNTNRRLLKAYKGADGIKTGYTRAAGFNLVASAERGNERVIATVFGGKSTASRNARVAELLDMGFRRAPSKAVIRKPSKAAYQPENTVVAGKSNTSKSAGKSILRISAVKVSYRPKLRPSETKSDIVLDVKAPVTPTVLPNNIHTAVQAAQDTPPPAIVAPTIRPKARPSSIVLANTEQNSTIIFRPTTSGGGHWGVNVGRYPSRYKAEQVLLQTALTEMSSLDGSRRKVVQRPQGFDANFIGMTHEVADLACRRLQARNVVCFMIDPS